MPITREVLTRLGASATHADRYLEPLNVATAAHGIDTELRLAHFLAQVMHESSCLKHVVENMNYSAEGLLKVFPRHFRSRADADGYARKPDRIGSRVYGGRMGNGNEASGDGYRYRGRGLIQLTGKDNYRAFSRWVGEDVVANPDLVAEKYAVHSAVFFWDTNRLNAMADTDDLRATTRAINGGLNGFADRRELLETAKAALKDLRLDGGAGIAGATTPFNPTHRVLPTQLNLRSEPRVAADTWIAALNQGSEVEKRGDGGVEGWLRVRVALNQVLREGYVAERYLAALPARPRARGAVAGPGAAAPAAPVSAIAPAHLQHNRRDITRARDGGRAYPLGEAGRPGRGATTPAGKAAQLLAIADYLDSAAAAHLRYQPKSGTTYCNIYACDYCYLAGVYLPRVWWTDRALEGLHSGEDVAVAYGRTVRELNANALHDWLEDHGTGHGWQREIDLTTLQAAANAGEVCLIVGKRRDLNRSGHIVAVAPEHAGFDARRNAAGEVLRPVESQAGTRNFRYAVGRSAWWLNARFQSFAFWRHR